jgi:hypothetical protein
MSGRRFPPPSDPKARMAQCCRQTQNASPVGHVSHCRSLLSVRLGSTSQSSRRLFGKIGSDLKSPRGSPADKGWGTARNEQTVSPMLNVGPDKRSELVCLLGTQDEFDDGGSVGHGWLRGLGGRRWTCLFRSGLFWPPHPNFPFPIPL